MRPVITDPGKLWKVMEFKIEIGLEKCGK